VKYWELQDYTMVSATTIQDYTPRGICFPTGHADGVCFAAFDDCTRVLKLDEDNRKPKLLDVINKPYKQVLDLKLSSDNKNLYCL
jgi:hypothetical protein